MPLHELPCGRLSPPLSVLHPSILTVAAFFFTFGRIVFPHLMTRMAGWAMFLPCVAALCSFPRCACLSGYCACTVSFLGGHEHSTWVIVGPRAQLASMFHPARATAAAAYIGSLIFALFAAFFGGRLRYPLVLISLVVEVLARTLWLLPHPLAYLRHVVRVRVLPASLVPRPTSVTLLLDCFAMATNPSLLLSTESVCSFCPFAHWARTGVCARRAVVWYSLSYIPFGRQALSRLTGISW